MSSKRCHIHSYRQMTQLSRTASKSFPASSTFPLSEGVLNRGDFCRQQFTLAADFPSSNLLVRNPAGEPARSLYLTNDLVRAVLSANDYKRIRIMTAGTKIFMRQESGFGRREFDGEDSASTERVPRFRLLSEGLPVVLPYIKPDTIIDTDIPALHRLLETYYPLLNGFGEGFQRDVGSRRACVLLFFRFVRNIFPSSDYLALR
jgi:multisite-specific tRNA:(cytosine-C5)-methyltransferase